MKIKMNFFAALFFAIGIFAFTACESEDDAKLQENDPTTLKTLAEDYISVAGLFVLSDIDEQTSGDTQKSATVVEGYDCRIVTIHENDNGEFWPRRWSIDYGETGCEGLTGNIRKGVINIELTDFWKNSGSQRTITFDNFYQNENLFKGTKTITNNGENENGNLVFEKNIAGELVDAEGNSMTWNCNRFSEMTAGQETFLFNDDSYAVSGSSNGTNYDGNAFTMTITEPLIYNSGCFWPVSGVVVIDTEGESTITIDYGTGECDTEATSTIDGVTTTINL